MTVYFIQNPETGLVKIGKTKNTSVRFRQLCNDFNIRLKMLGVIRGYSQQEKRMHRTFQNLKVRGEWFKPSRRLLKFIRNHTIEFKGRLETPEDYLNRVNCQESTSHPSGRCTRRSLPGEKYCRYHLLRHKSKSEKVILCKAVKLDGTPCTRPKPRNSLYCGRHKYWEGKH